MACNEILTTFLEKITILVIYQSSKMPQSREKTSNWRKNIKMAKKRQSGENLSKLTLNGFLGFFHEKSFSGGMQGWILFPVIWFSFRNVLEISTTFLTSRWTISMIWSRRIWWNSVKFVSKLLMMVMTVGSWTWASIK